MTKRPEIRAELLPSARQSDAAAELTKPTDLMREALDFHHKMQGTFGPLIERADRSIPIRHRTSRSHRAIR